MSEENKIGTYQFVAEPFHVDFNGRLTMGVLGNHLLNCAGFHASDRGFGIATLNEDNYTWVLSRLAVELDEMPYQYENFSVQTWVENVYRLFTDRNFSIIDKDGKKIGYARSVWAMISLNTRKPADLLTLHGGSIVDYVCDEPCPIEKPSRIKVTSDRPVATLTAKYSDIDINGHVNSIRYIEHILDLFPIDLYKTKRIRRFEMAYVAESYFGCGLGAALSDAPRPMRLLVSLVVNLATAVWMPRGGYWYQGTIGGTIYHNTTYIMLAPFALLAMLAFYRVWPTMRGKLDLRAYAVYTVLLTVATSFKASLIFAFAPALLVLLIVDFVGTRAKNLKNEIIMGCSVFPGVALCVIQASVLFAEDDSGVKLIFTVPFDHHRMLWGPFNEAGALGLARSFVFVAAVGLLLGRAAWQSFRYRFSLFTFAVSLAEALLLVESGERLYHANLWWGPFICFWVLWLESVSVFLQQLRAKAAPCWRLVLCAAALAWHVISGVCFLVMLMRGVSYNVPILTYNLW